MHHPDDPRVHLLVGLNGSGKSTFARQLESDLPAVRFSLDEWMLRLHQLSFDDADYPALAAECRSLIWDIACQVLHTGTSVVLDWNVWSRAQRHEWTTKATQAGFAPVVHYIVVPVGEAVARAEGRNDVSSHRLTEDGIRHLQSILEVPDTDEGFELDVVEGS